MDTSWASERLETIRTLMERSAVYRRALAPIMLMLGLLGFVSGATGAFLEINTPARFTLFWLSISFLGLAGAFIQIRRQSLKDQEPFWSPPTRRVFQALIPPLFAGAMLSFCVGLTEATAPFTLLLVPTWMLFYGCALHAAGFFMPRGFKLFGWLFLASGAALLYGLLRFGPDVPLNYGHLLMAFFFGGYHFAYGVYLYFTEKRQTA